MSGNDHPKIDAATEKAADGFDYVKEKLGDAKDAVMGRPKEEQNIVEAIKTKAAEATDAIQYFVEESEKKLLDEA